MYAHTTRGTHTCILKTSMQSNNKVKQFLTSSPASPSSDPPGSPYTTTKTLVRFIFHMSVCVNKSIFFNGVHWLKVVKQVTYWWSSHTYRSLQALRKSHTYAFSNRNLYVSFCSYRYKYTFLAAHKHACTLIRGSLKTLRNNTILKR